jgi:hypothetical protein
MALPFGFLSQISKCFERLIGFRRTVLQAVQVNRSVIFLVVLACREGVCTREPRGCAACAASARQSQAASRGARTGAVAHLLVEDGLRLPTEASLLVVITALACASRADVGALPSADCQPAAPATCFARPNPNASGCGGYSAARTLRHERGLAGLVLRHLECLVVAALGGLAEGARRLGGVHLCRGSRRWAQRTLAAELALPPPQQGRRWASAGPGLRHTREASRALRVCQLRAHCAVAARACRAAATRRSGP